MKPFARNLVFASLFMIIPFLVQSQENEKSAKIVHIQTVENTNGKVILTDTTFTVPDDEDISKKVIEKYVKTGSSETGTIKVMVDIEEEESGERGKKVIVIKNGGEEEETLVTKGGSGKVYVYEEEETPDEVTDIELRDAGIKNKPDRLELPSLEVDNDDGIVKLAFKMEEQGNPKVTLYNIYGDKVFSGTPEMKDGKYKITIDLSKKQHGTYYLMIVSGNSSKTIRIRN